MASEHLNDFFIGLIFNEGDGEGVYEPLWRAAYFAILLGSQEYLPRCSAKVAFKSKAELI